MIVRRNIRALAALLERDGIRMDLWPGGRHFRGVAIRGDVRVPVTVAISPSDRRWMKNQLAQVRRALRAAEGGNT